MMESHLLLYCIHLSVSDSFLLTQVTFNESEKKYVLGLEAYTFSSQKSQEESTGFLLFPLT